MLSLDASEVNALFDQISNRHMPEVRRLALNDMAFAVLDENRDLMARSFDSPTLWTLRSFRVKKATLSNPVATVERTQVAASRHYLEVQQDGGTRGTTAFERLVKRHAPQASGVKAMVPTSNVRKNKYGNVSRSRQKAIVAGLGAGSKNAGSKSKAVRYFVPQRNSKLAAGIWQEQGRKLKLLYMFSHVAPHYDAKFPMQEHATDVARARAAGAVERAIMTRIERLK